MSKKSRYIILALGVVFFLILAPIIVLYVRGISYDFASGSFVHSGILAVRSEPKNAQIFLNGKLTRNDSGDIRFLTQNEYQVTLKANGYQDWSKRLPVTNGEVTWANPQNNNIYLFYSQPQEQTLANNVSDFYTEGGDIVYLQDKSASVKSGGLFAHNNTYSLPLSVDKILAWDNDGKKFIFTDSSTASSAKPTLLYFDASSGQTINLSGLFTNLPKFQFLDSDLLALSQGNLYLVNLAKDSKKVIFPSVKTFSVQGSSVYYVQATGTKASLSVSQGPFTQSQILLNQVPTFKQGDLFVTFNKQIYLLADGVLYQDNGTMQKLADNVSQFTFDNTNSNFAIFHSGEFDYLDFYSGGLNFITRSGGQLSNLQIRSSVDYAFYSNNNQISAIELDARDSQNQFVLYSAQNPEKFFVDSSGQNMLVLDGTVLKSLKIR